MKEVIQPVARELLEAELTEKRRLRHTNKADNEIYIVDAFCAPNTMREIGRLREIAFRDAGGGTGKDCDIDEFDTMNPSHPRQRHTDFRGRCAAYSLLPHVPLLPRLHQRIPPAYH